jgi:hypothetical protein
MAQKPAPQKPNPSPAPGPKPPGAPMTKPGK